jgi:hypothetical protein
VGRPDGQITLGRPSVDGGIPLKRIFKKWDGEAWNGFLWHRIRTGGGRGDASEYGNEGSIKCVEFLD